MRFSIFSHIISRIYGNDKRNFFFLSIILLKKDSLERFLDLHWNKINFSINDIINLINRNESFKISILLYIPSSI